jgi:hypothetical protein
VPSHGSRKPLPSEALFLVVLQHVPDSYIRSTATTPVSARLQSLSQMVLSRRSLESVVREFGLYGEERQHAPMEAVIENMRKDIDITPQSDNTSFVFRWTRSTRKPQTTGVPVEA